MTQNISKLLRYVRDFGADEVLFKILSKLGYVQEYRSLEVFCMDLRLDADKRLRQKLDSPTFLIKEVSREEFAQLKLAADLPPQETFRKKFDQGSRLFTVLDQNTVVAVGWYDEKFADLTYIGKSHVPLPKGQAYMHGAYVTSAYRGKGIGSYTKQTILKKLRERGFSGVFTAAFLSRDVLRWHRSNGLERWGKLLRFRRKGREYFWVRRSARGRSFFPDFLSSS